jgi:hypothetical protein
LKNLFPQAANALKPRPLISKELVEEINSKKPGWTASLDQGKKT